MYDKYFHDRSIDKALRDQQKCNESLDDYFFHIINFTNPNRDLDQLEILRDIWNMIDLKNISRLKSTSDSLAVACEIYKKLKKHIENKQKQTPTPTQQKPGNCQSGNCNNPGTSSKAQETKNKNGNNKSQSAPAKPKKELSKRQQKILENAIESQRKFLNGEQKKRGKLSKAQAQTVKAPGS